MKVKEFEHIRQVTGFYTPAEMRQYLALVTSNTEPAGDIEIPDESCMLCYITSRMDYYNHKVDRDRLIPAWLTFVAPENRDEVRAQIQAICDDAERPGIPYIPEGYL